MSNFQNPERPNNRDPDERLNRMLRAGEMSLDAQLGSLRPPVPDDRFTLPSPTRRSLFNEMLDEIEKRYAGDRLIELMTTQTRDAAADLVSVLENYNKGNGPVCLESVRTLARRVEDVEGTEIGGMPSLTSYITENLIHELLPDIESPRSKVLMELLQARVQSLSAGIGVPQMKDTLHTRMTIMAGALDGIITAIEAHPSRLEQESTRERATQNIQKFIEDLKLPGTTQMETGTCRKGRYEFQLKLGSHHCTVSMPGLTIDEVRPPDATTADTGPVRERLLVDGSSWFWEFALDIARDSLLGRCEE